MLSARNVRGRGKDEHRNETTASSASSNSRRFWLTGLHRIRSHAVITLLASAAFVLQPENGGLLCVEAVRDPFSAAAGSLLPAGASGIIDGAMASLGLAESEEQKTERDPMYKLRDAMNVELQNAGAASEDTRKALETAAQDADKLEMNIELSPEVAEAAKKTELLRKIDETAKDAEAPTVLLSLPAATLFEHLTDLLMIDAEHRLTKGADEGIQARPSKHTTPSHSHQQLSPKGGRPDENLPQLVDELRNLKDELRKQQKLQAIYKLESQQELHRASAKQRPKLLREQAKKNNEIAQTVNALKHGTLIE